MMLKHWFGTEGHGPCAELANLHRNSLANPPQSSGPKQNAGTWGKMLLQLLVMGVARFVVHHERDNVMPSLYLLSLAPFTNRPLECERVLCLVLAPSTPWQTKKKNLGYPFQVGLAHRCLCVVYVSICVRVQSVVFSKETTVM